MTGPDAVDHVTSMLPEVMVATVRQMIDQARSLGFTWTLRLATVANVSPLKIILDGDAETDAVNAVAMIPEINASQRVYVIIIPPAGNFVVGSATELVVYSRLGNATGFQFGILPGSTTSATPVAMTGPPACVVRKTYGKLLTRFKFSFAGTFYAIGGDGGAAFYAVSTATGTTIQLAALNASNSTNGVRQFVGGIALSTSGAHDAGTYTWDGYWARIGGAGTLNVDSNDMWCLSVEEIVIQ